MGIHHCKVRKTFKKNSHKLLLMPTFLLQLPCHKNYYPWEKKLKTTTTATYPYSSPTHPLCFCMIRNIKGRVCNHQIKIMFLCARKKQSVSFRPLQKGGRQVNLGILRFYTIVSLIQICLTLV